MLTVPASYKLNYVKDYKDTVSIIDAAKASRYLRLEGNDNDNTILASSKGSLLWGRRGDDLLVGDKGVDTFRFFGDEGNDTIVNYQSGRDIISLGSANYGALKRADVKGNDVILSIGEGTITVRNGKGKKIKIAVDNGKTSVSTFTSGGYTYDSSKGKFLTDKAWAAAQAAALAAAHNPKKGLHLNDDFTTLTANAAYTAKKLAAGDFRDTITTIDASAMRKKVSIYGNGNDNVLKAGKAGSYLWGAAGDDILYGGNGADTFSFSGDEGNDTIVNYQSGKDIISLGNDEYGALRSATVSGNDVILTIGKGTLTIKDAKGQAIQIVDGSDDKRTSLTRFNEGTVSYLSTTGNFLSLDDSAVNMYATMPKGMVYNAKKTAVTIKSNYTSNSMPPIEANKFWSTVKSINAASAKSGLEIIGNDNVTSITGSRYTDTLTAGNGNVKLNGGNGDDFLQGGNGTNKLYGGNGNDNIYGGSGENYLYGGNGNDTLVGGSGTNTLRGGAGADTLTGGSGKNTYFYGSMAETKGDTITNFREDDTLYFDLKKNALDLDAIYQNYNLQGKDATGKNTIALHDNILTITDKNKRKYSITLSEGCSNSITIANKSGQSQTFNL